MVRNSLSTETNVVLKMYKTLIRSHIGFVLRPGFNIDSWKLECYIEIREYTKNSDKNNKKSKRLQLQGEIG